MTLKRARRRLDVESERVGGAAEAGHWVWRLPKEVSAKGLVPISDFDPLSVNPHFRAENGQPESLRGSSETDNAREGEQEADVVAFEQLLEEKRRAR